MKKSFFIALLAVAAVAFSACNTVTDNFLIGKWRATYISYTEWENGEVSSSGKEYYVGEYAENAPIVEFFEDGRLGGDFGDDLGLTYVLSKDGKKLIIDEGDDALVLFIEKISPKEIEIGMREEEVDEDGTIYAWEECFGFERVK